MKGGRGIADRGERPGEEVARHRPDDAEWHARDGGKWKDAGDRRRPQLAGGHHLLPAGRCSPWC